MPLLLKCFFWVLRGRITNNQIILWQPEGKIYPLESAATTGLSFYKLENSATKTNRARI